MHNIHVCYTKFVAQEITCLPLRSNILRNLWFIPVTRDLGSCGNHAIDRVASEAPRILSNKTGYIQNQTHTLLPPPTTTQKTTEVLFAKY